VIAGRLVWVRGRRGVAVFEYDAQAGRATPQALELTRAQHDAAESDLSAGLTGLSGILVGDLTMDQLLTQVAEFAARAIPGVDGAGVTLAHPSEVQSGIRVWAVNAEFIREIDVLQYEVHNEGPCITSMRTRRPCITGSMADDTRWPRFGPAVARLRVLSALSLPLLLANQVVGAINAYAHSADAFAEHAVAMGTRFAGPAAVSIHNAKLLMEARHRAEQLQRALGGRSAIDQAIGIIRASTGASVEEAFGWLVSVSQAENLKLHIVAERLIDTRVRRARARATGALDD